MSLDDDFKALIRKGEEQLSELKILHLAALDEMKGEHEAEINELRMKLNYRFELELSELKEGSASEIEKIKSRSTSLVFSILAVVVIAVVAFLYTATNDIFTNTATINQSVITLQSSLLSAQQSISQAQSELKAAKEAGDKTIKDSMDSLATAKSDLEGAIITLDAARQNLVESKHDYDKLLSELRVSESDQ